MVLFAQCLHLACMLLLCARQSCLALRQLRVQVLDARCTAAAGLQLLKICIQPRNMACGSLTLCLGALQVCLSSIQRAFKPVDGLLLLLHLLCGRCKLLTQP